MTKRRVFGIAIMLLCWIPAWHLSPGDIAAELVGAFLVFKKPRAT